MTETPTEDSIQSDTERSASSERSTEQFGVWQPIESAPHEQLVLLAWQDWRDGKWCMQVGYASQGRRYDNGWSNLSHHGSATRWMPVPPPPSNDDRGVDPESAGVSVNQTTEETE